MKARAVELTRYTLTR